MIHDTSLYRSSSAKIGAYVSQELDCWPYRAASFATECFNKHPNEISPTHPDKVLFDRAKEEMRQKNFTVANLDLQVLLNTYPTSKYAANAKSLSNQRPNKQAAALLRKLAKDQNNPELAEGLEGTWRREQIVAIVREIFCQ